MAVRLVGFLVLLGLAARGQWLRVHPLRTSASPPPLLPAHHFALRRARAGTCREDEGGGGTQHIRVSVPRSGGLGAGRGGLP